MRKSIILIAAFLLLINFKPVYAQSSPKGKQLGFGIVFGEPFGGTLKYWTNTKNAYVFDIGASYFGSPRIGVDYLWHFNAFNSRNVNLYAGPGAALGFGVGHGIWYNDQGAFYYRSGVGLGIRGVLGVDFVPENSPFEMFFEAGLLIGITPNFGSAGDVALGVRFYP